MNPSAPQPAELLEQLRHWAQTPFAQSVSIPSQVYTSKAFLDLEIEHIFKRQWICAGRVDEVSKPGDYFSFDIAEYPIIVLRDEANAIRAMSNVCRHRATLLVSGAGNCRAFTCPYHAWTYNLDGGLRTAPYMDRTASFDKTTLALPQYRVEVWQGFIYVNLDENAPPFARNVAGLDALFERHSVADLQFAFRGSMEVACNWKVQVENFCESYHVFQVHPQTIEPVMTTASVKVQSGGTGFNHHTQRPPEGFVDPGPQVYPYLQGDDRSTFNLMCVYPSHAVALGAEFISWLSVHPRGTDRCVVHYAGALPGEQPDGKVNAARAEETRAYMLEFMAEDILRIEAVQRGFVAYAGGSPYCEMEKTNWEFGRYIVNQVCADRAI